MTNPISFPTIDLSLESSADLSKRDIFFRDTLQMLKFLHDHPELPIPQNFTLLVQTFDDPETPELASRIAQNLRTFKKDMSDSFFNLSKTFGSVTISYNFWRSSVCERKVVGTRKVNRTDPAAPTIEVDEDIIEWDCPSILDHPKKAPAGAEAGASIEQPRQQLTEEDEIQF